MVRKTETVTVSMPIGLAKRAQSLDVNVSFHCTHAVMNEIQRLEKMKIRKGEAT